MSMGASILGAFLGRKTLSAGNIGRVTTAARSASRIGRESEDVERANENLDVLQQRLRTLEAEVRDGVRTRFRLRMTAERISH